MSNVLVERFMADGELAARYEDRLAELEGWIIEGRLEVDPGGLVYAYGQTLRLESAEVIYEGLPEEVVYAVTVGPDFARSAVFYETALIVAGGSGCGCRS